MITKKQAEEMLTILGGLIMASIALHTEVGVPVDEIVKEIPPIVADDICEVLDIDIISTI